jgi:PAS domain S-box-containing protein
MHSSTDPVRVLHVDDDPDLVAVAAACLEREDERFDVLTATDATAALATLEEEPVDCVVSDYEMPGRDGIELLEAVREAHPDLPFVLFTGRGSEEVASEAISAGVTDYLQKGTDPSQYAVLANRVANAVDQHTAVREAERTRRRLEELTDNVADCLWMFDADWSELLFISGYEAVWGRPETAIRENPRDFLEGVHPDDREFVRSVMADLTAGEGIDVEYRIVRGDGETGWVWAKGQPVVEDGEVVRVVGFTRDVTDRKRHERELERTTARLEGLFAQSPDMINVHDGDGNLLDPNPRLCEATGYDADELTEMKVWDVDPTVDPEEVTAFWAGMDVGARRRFEGTYRRKDGSTFPVELHVRRLDTADADRFLVIARDVTERRARREELRRQNERLEEFASVVSHDLRNPLNVARGQLDLAREATDDEHLDAVAAAHDRMARLVEDLLELAREGDAVHDPGPVDLDALAADCWRTVETGDATLETAVEGRVVADRGRLRRLLENLVRNAVEHGSTGGQNAEHSGDVAERSSAGSRTESDDAVEHGSTSSQNAQRPDDDGAGADIDGERTADGGTDAGVTVTVGTTGDGFYVADDGVGVPAAEREQVFEAGYSTHPDGTGFGLAIVEEVCDAHDWSVAITESAAGGARFEVTGVDVPGE